MGARDRHRALAAALGGGNAGHGERCPISRPPSGRGSRRRRPRRPGPTRDGMAQWPATSAPARIRGWSARRIARTTVDAEGPTCCGAGSEAPDVTLCIDSSAPLALPSRPVTALTRIAVKALGCALPRSLWRREHRVDVASRKEHDDHGSRAGNHAFDNSASRRHHRARRPARVPRSRSSSLRSLTRRSACAPGPRDAGSPQTSTRRTSC